MKRPQLVCFCVLEGFFGDGAQRGPCGSGVGRACSWEHWQEKVPRRWQWLMPGVALSLLSLSWASLKKFPQVLLYLPRVSLLLMGCRAGSASEGGLVTEQLSPPGEGKAPKH